MTLGANTVTVTINTVEKTLTRINQDNFGSQYYLRESTQEFTLNVRHSREAPLQDGRRYDRHNVELTHTVFPTESSAGYTRVGYMVFRMIREDNYEASADTFSGLVGFVDPTVVEDLLSWKN